MILITDIFKPVDASTYETMILKPYSTDFVLLYEQKLQ